MNSTQDKSVKVIFLVIALLFDAQKPAWICVPNANFEQAWDGNKQRCKQDAGIHSFAFNGTIK